MDWIGADAQDYYVDAQSSTRNMHRGLQNRESDDSDPLLGEKAATKGGCCARRLKSCRMDVSKACGCLAFTMLVTTLGLGVADFLLSPVLSSHGGVGQPHTLAAQNHLQAVTGYGNLGPSWERAAFNFRTFGFWWTHCGDDDFKDLADWITCDGDSLWANISVHLIGFFFFGMIFFAPLATVGRPVFGALLACCLGTILSISHEYIGVGRFTDPSMVALYFDQTGLVLGIGTAFAMGRCYQAKKKKISRNSFATVAR